MGFDQNAIRDLRYGLRLLRRSPIFAAVAILAIPHPQELAEVRPDGRLNRRPTQ